jgi:hypothetical protein
MSSVVPLWEVAVSGSGTGSLSDRAPNTKAIKDKWRRICSETLEDIFSAARQSGVVLTPDEALIELDDALKEVFSKAGVLEGRAGKAGLHRPLPIDVVAFRTKVHHRAVDLYYQTYFPRKAGMEGKPRRGRSRLPLEYLDQLLTLHKKGLNPAQIASTLGESGLKAKGRIAKQIRIAEKRYAELVANVQALGRRQQERNSKQS